MLSTINSAVEYALYALALRCPDMFEEAERFGGWAMLAEDHAALARVKALMSQERPLGVPMTVVPTDRLERERLRAEKAEREVERLSAELESIISGAA